MAEYRNDNPDAGSGNVATVAIVVLVVIALIAGYFLFFQGRTANTGPDRPDIEIDLGSPDPAPAPSPGQSPN
jgi:hypothetical protein